VPALPTKGAGGWPRRAPRILFRLRAAIAHCGEGEATSRAHARGTRASASFRFSSSPFTGPTFSPERQAFWGEHRPSFLSSPQV